MTKFLMPQFARSRFTHSPLIYGGGIRKGAAGAAGLTTLSFIASATSADSATVTGPAEILAGDVIFMADWGEPDSGGNVTPTDFTSIIATNNSGVYLDVSRKIATGAEASASITGIDLFEGNKIIAVFRGDIAVSAVADSTPTAEITSVNPAGQAIGSGSGASPLIAFGLQGELDASMSALTADIAPDATISSAVTTSLHLAYWIYNTSPQNLNIDKSDGGFNMLAGFYSAIS